MKKIIFISILLFLTTCHNDDDLSRYEFKGEVAFSKIYGGSFDEFVRGVINTNDGGFLVVGYTKSEDHGEHNHGGNNNQIIEDAWVSKFNANGEMLWSKTYGGSEDDYAFSAVENNDGSFTIAGYSSSSDGDVPSNNGLHDFFVFKISSSGNLIWSKSYGYTSHDHAYTIIKTADNGYIVAGYTDYSGGVGFIENNGGVDRTTNIFQGQMTKNNRHGVGEYYLIKLDANGNKIWDTFFGGTQNERISDIVESNDGGFVMAGYSESNDFDVTGNHGSYDYWVIKINNIGESVWKKSYGGSEIDQAYGIAKTNNNSYLITGVSNSTDGDISNNLGGSDIWVIHIDDNGTKLWDKSYGGSGFDTANAIKKTTNGNFIITGHTRSNNALIQNKGENDIFSLIISPTGQVIWQKTFGGSKIDLGYDATQLDYNSFIIVGETQSVDFDAIGNNGKKDLLILKVH